MKKKEEEDIEAKRKNMRKTRNRVLKSIKV
jgi:hypothetical protein